MRIHVARDQRAEFASLVIGPQIVGEALRAISDDADVLVAMFEILETEKMLEGKAELIILPSGTDPKILTDLVAAKGVSI